MTRVILRNTRASCLNWFPLGFDAQALSTSSIKTYNSSGNTFFPIASTGIPLYNKNGYFIFVRGDRSVTEFQVPAVPTIMRSKGQLFQPHSGYAPPNVTVLGGSKFELVGNPYASPISIQFMNSNSGYFNNLTNNVIVWDPLLPGSQGLGGYQTLSASLGFTPTPGGTTTVYRTGISYPEIQSGQAFFVQTSGTSAGWISFNELVKSSNYSLVTRMNNLINQKSFKANLYFDRNLCDGNAVIFDKGFKNDLDENDAGKLLNPGENFMISKGKNVFLAVEARSTINSYDSIIYSFSNLRKITYQLKLAPENLWEFGLHAKLVDKYLNTKTSLSLTDSSFVDFTVDDKTASFENRFIIVFERNQKEFGNTVSSVASKNKSINTGSFVIFPNPAENKTIKISFINQASGVYLLQLINNTGQVIKSNSVKITNAHTTSLIKLDNRVAAGNYELIIIAQDGRKYIRQVLVK